MTYRRIELRSGELLSGAFRPAGRERPRLFEELPQLEQHVAWTPVAHLPTPVEPLTRLHEFLGRSDVWVKREDLTSPLYGGNKVRRFEFILAEAARRGAKRIVTVGGYASTQVTATVAFGRAAGFEVEAVLFDQPITGFLKRALAHDAAMGGHLIRGGSYPRTIAKTIAALPGRDRPFFLMPGASDALYNLAYIDMMYELADQVRRGEMPRPDCIVVPCGSGGTVAAIAVGARLLGWPTEVIGVRITDRVVCNRLVLRYRMEATARLLRRKGGARGLRGPYRFALDHSAIGDGYGFPTDESRRAASQVERFAGAEGEITYSGKGLAALARIARSRPGETILYVHTLSSREPSEQGSHQVPAEFRDLLSASEVA